MSWVWAWEGGQWNGGGAAFVLIGTVAVAALAAGDVAGDLRQKRKRGEKKRDPHTAHAEITNNNHVPLPKTFPLPTLHNNRTIPFPSFPAVCVL